MKKLLLLFTFCFTFFASYAQSVGIGTTAPNNNAMLEIRSNTKGVLMPRLSTASRNAMTNVQKGMMVYDSTLSGFYFHDGGKWRPFSERNTDSLISSGSINTPAITANMSRINLNATTSAASGILYDNGGPSANYTNDAYDRYVVDHTNNDSIVGYKVVIEQMNLAAGDTFAIYVADDVTTAKFLAGTTTGTFYFAATNALVFLFASNATGNTPGFRVRWGVITSSTSSVTAPPLYGWHFNERKVAVRGGINGLNSLVTDSLGKLSFAYGSNTKAKGINAIAMGNIVSARGNYSLAIGQFANADSTNAIALGYNVKANADQTMALGFSNTASATGAIAIGTSSKASGEYSMAIGYDNEATGNYATANGKATIASGNLSFSSGSQTTASGENSFTANSSTIASGNSSTAMGLLTIASGSNATAMGISTTAQGSGAVAMGNQTLAKSYSSLAIGRFNDDFGVTSALWNATDPLFMIGNGTSAAAPNNAFVVLKNGNTGIGINNPRIKLQIGGGTDASLADNSGFLMIGDVNGGNIVFDGNEIIARNNGANSTLFLQNSGGALETGGAAAKPGGGSWTATSDARLKQNVLPYKDGLQQLLKINPVVYQYNQLSGYDTEKKYIGVLAQQVKEVAPYMVGTFLKDETEYYSVDNTAMTYMLINAVKEQQQQIEVLTNTVNSLLKNQQ